MIRQRTGLRRALGRAMSLAALLAGLWLPSVALGDYPTNNEGLELVPFTINVHNNIPFHLFVYIHGIIAERTPTLPPGKAVYVTNVQGDVALTPVISAGSLALDLGTAATTTIMFPKLKGVRVYFSVNNPLLVSSGQQGIIPDILGGGWTPSGANYNTIFDWLELDWQNEGPNPYNLATRFGGNATQVDMFGFPMFMDMTGTDFNTGQKVDFGAGYTNTRSTIMAAYSSLGAPWTNLIATSNTGAVTRVISPYHGMENGTFSSSFLDNYINSVWSFYATNTMYASAENSNYNGSVQNGSLVFSEGGIPKFQFSKPSTFNVFLNEIYNKDVKLLVTEPRTAEKAGVVASALGGAFMRTVLLVNPNLMACQVSQFYVNDPVNRYAKLWHQYAWLNLAYAFGYDDTCSQSSFQSVGDPTAVTIHIIGN